MVAQRRHEVVMGEEDLDGDISRCSLREFSVHENSWSTDCFHKGMAKRVSVGLICRVLVVAVACDPTVV